MLGLYLVCTTILLPVLLLQVEQQLMATQGGLSELPASVTPDAIAEYLLDRLVQVYTDLHAFTVTDIIGVEEAGQLSQHYLQFGR
jgi:hypothetical protein